MLKKDSETKDAKIKCHINCIENFSQTLIKRALENVPEKNKPEQAQRKDIIEITGNEKVVQFRLISENFVYQNDLDRLTKYLGSGDATQSYLGGPIINSAIHWKVPEKTIERFIHHNFQDRCK